MQTEQLKPTVIHHAPPTLVEEILEETKLRGLLDIESAAEQAKQRVTALNVLMHAAIGATKPIHWLLFKNPQGQIFARFNFSGAQRIATVFGITVTPKGPVKISTDHGKRRTAEVYGKAHSAVLNVTFDNIRAYRVEGEDFLGRPAEDTTRGQGERAKTVAGVGDNDWIQSTQTALISKGVRLISGLVTVSPEELAEVWDITPEEVIEKCTMGMGFSSQERNAANAGQVVSEARQKRMFGIAKGRIDQLGVKAKSADVVSQCIHTFMPGAKADEVTLEHYDNICAAIEKWEPGKAPAAPAGDTASNGTDVTAGQIKTIKDRANERAKALPEAGTDGEAILYEAIYEVFGDHRPVEKIPQDKMVAVMTAINSWGAKQGQGQLV